MKNRHLVSSMRRVMVMSLWEQVVGSIVAQKSWPEKIIDGVLTVGVISHPWAAELDLIKPQILSRYRQLLGRSALRDVAFHVTRRKSRKDEETHAPLTLRPPREERLHVTPTPPQLLSGIHNPEVRDLLAPVFARLRAEREWKREHGWAQCGVCGRFFHGADCPHCRPPLDIA